MGDAASITEQSTVTIGLLVGSIGTLIVATAAFVNMRRDLRENTEALKKLSGEMLSRDAFKLWLARLQSTAKIDVPDLEESL